MRGELVVLRRDVERGDLRLGDRVRQARQDRRAELPGDLVRRREALRSDDRREEHLRVGDLERVCAERAQADHPELGVAHHHRVRRAPLQVREEPHVEEVDVGLERRLEAVFPTAERRRIGRFCVESW